MNHIHPLAALLLGLPLLPLPCLAEEADGPLAELGAQLAERGIKTHATFLSLSMKNLDTGPRPHSFGNSGDLFLGADLDLKKNAHIALTRHFALEPSVQYIFNPDNYYNPGAREISGDGFVVGLQVTLDVGSLLGL